MESKETAVMKDAAYRLQEFLASKNIKLQHAAALEALTASLGIRNWRTLRDKLSEPNQLAVPTLESLEGCRWTIKGRYYDGSPYGDYFAGETPLEAKIQALYYRLYEDRGSAFTVCAVEDRLTGETIDEGILRLSDLQEHGKLFQSILGMTRRVLGTPAEVAAAGNEGRSVLNAVVEGLEEAIESDKLREQLTVFTKRMPPTCSEADSSVGFESKDGTLITYYMPDALADILEFLRENKAVLSEPELESLYQYGSLLDYFDDKVSRILVTFLAVG